MCETSFIKNTAEVFKALGTNHFGQTLVDTIYAQVPFDGSVIILFHPQHDPKILQEQLSIVDHEVFWKSYMRDLYYLDPFYKLCSQGKKGMYHLQDILPWGFCESRYFKQYFNPANLKDEINYLFQTDNGISGLLCVSRSATLSGFSNEERRKLQNMTEFIDAAILRHIEISDIRFESCESDHSPLLVQATLDKFSDENLTQREYEITNLMLRGFSSKATANHLTISPETERSHRKNIYKKMNVNSHAELLANVFESLLMESKAQDTNNYGVHHGNGISRTQ